MVVNFILLSTFKETDFNENPYIVLSCRYILTIKSIDRYISMLNFYTVNCKGLIVDLKNSAKPFFTSRIKSYLTCYSPL
jgi:hypothetical protein